MANSVGLQQTAPLVCCVFTLFAQAYAILFDLFDLMLYVHSKQLRSCWDGHLLNHTVPGQASWRQVTSILKSCHTKPRFHCIGTELFNFPERSEIARKP